LIAAIVWQAGLWTAFVLMLVPVFVDLTVGNIHLLLAAAILLGFRWPWTWSFVLLTKITPGIGTAVVRGSTGVAIPRDRAGRDGDRGRRVVRDRAVAVVGVGRRPPGCPPAPQAPRSSSRSPCRSGWSWPRSSSRGAR